MDEHMDETHGYGFDAYMDEYMDMGTWISTMSWMEYMYVMRHMNKHMKTFALADVKQTSDVNHQLSPQAQTHSL